MQSPLALPAPSVSDTANTSNVDCYMEEIELELQVLRGFDQSIKELLEQVDELDPTKSPSSKDIEIIHKLKHECNEALILCNRVHTQFHDLKNNLNRPSQSPSHQDSSPQNTAAGGDSTTVIVVGSSVKKQLFQNITSRINRSLLSLQFPRLSTTISSSSSLSLLSGDDSKLQLLSDRFELQLNQLQQLCDHSTKLTSRFHIPATRISQPSVPVSGALPGSDSTVPPLFVCSSSSSPKVNSTSTSKNSDDGSDDYSLRHLADSTHEMAPPTTETMLADERARVEEELEILSTRLAQFNYSSMDLETDDDEFRHFMENNQPLLSADGEVEDAIPRHHDTTPQPVMPPGFSEEDDEGVQEDSVGNVIDDNTSNDDEDDETQSEKLFSESTLPEERFSVKEMQVLLENFRVLASASPHPAFEDRDPKKHTATVIEKTLTALTSPARRLNQVSRAQWHGFFNGLVSRTKDVKSIEHEHTDYNPFDMNELLLSLFLTGRRLRLADTLSNDDFFEFEDFVRVIGILHRGNRIEKLKLVQTVLTGGGDTIDPERALHIQRSFSIELRHHLNLDLDILPQQICTTIEQLEECCEQSPDRPLSRISRSPPTVFGNNNWNKYLALMIGIRQSVDLAHSRATLFPSDFTVRIKQRLPTAHWFTTFAPTVFARLRQHVGITPEQMKTVFGPEHLLLELFMRGNLISFPHQGRLGGSKSGSEFIIPQHGSLILKEISKKERKFLMDDLLFKYYKHATTSKSLLSPLLGCFRVGQVSWILMRNELNADFDEIVDFKGSTLGRANREMKSDQHHTGRRSRAFVKKDLDFLASPNRRLQLDADKRVLFLSQLKHDAQFLSMNNVIDYSLLVGIRHSPTAQEAEATTPRSTQQHEEYHLAVIDYLTPFDLRKTGETMAKIVLHGDKDNFSVVPPQLYKERFLAFINNITC